MGDGTRLAIAILILFLAMFSFFIAFHPTGPNPANHPDDVLKWLLGEYDVTAGHTGGNAPVVTVPVSPAKTAQLLWLPSERLCRGKPRSALPPRRLLPIRVRKPIVFPLHHETSPSELRGQLSPQGHGTRKAALRKRRIQRMKLQKNLRLRAEGYLPVSGPLWLVRESRFRLPE